MIKTIIAWTILGAILFSGIWYFLLKKSDYSISFKSSGGKGEVYQSILYYPFEEKFESSRITQKVPFKKLVQKVNLDGENLELIWRFSEETESNSLVRVEVSSQNRFQNRLGFLLRNNDLKTHLTEEIKQVRTNLEENSNLYKVKILGEEVSPASTCACISLKNELNLKAFDMIRNINRLSDYILESNAEMTAKPRIVINRWDIDSNIISYDFCFPIAEKTITPLPTGIFIKEFPAVNSLKAIYNGNYMYSHLAWMQLLNYAEKNKLEVEKTPLEIFNNNPEMGGDARKWEAEIYMPLK